MKEWMIVAIYLALFLYLPIGWTPCFNLERDKKDALATKLKLTEKSKFSYLFIHN